MKTTFKKALSLTIALCLLFATVSCLTLLGSRVAAAGTLVRTTEIGTIPDGQQAIYKAEINYNGLGSVELVFGEITLLTIKGDDLYFGKTQSVGTFGKGVYKYEAAINPQQKLLTAKVTLPDGGTLTRASETMLGGTEVKCYVVGASKINSSSVTFENITVNSFNTFDTEPTSNPNIYNVVTSFDDAATTRNFAWTAAASFLGDSAMELKYRKVGASDWTTVTAAKETELAVVENEDYFKCDVTGLTPDTEYEYIIGKAGSADDADWISPYTFKTAAEDIDEFTFVALSDTQGMSSWYYHKFTKTAIEEAFEEVENPAFILHGGDVVDDGLNQTDWNRFFKAMGDRIATTPFFGTVGNHDCWSVIDTTKHPFYWGLHFNNPNNGGLAAYDQSYASQITTHPATANTFKEGIADETVYSFDYGDAHFVVINSGSYNGTYNKTPLKLLAEAQKEWLINDLEANKDAKWTVMLVHAQVHCFLGDDYDNDWLYDVIEDEDFGVDLVLHGDTHNVCRTYPMRDGQIVTKSAGDTIQKGIGTVYATMSATKPAHSSRTPGTWDGIIDETAALVAVPTQTQPTYTTVSVKGDELVVTTKQANGLVVDAFTIAETIDSGDSDGQKPPFVGDTSNTAATTVAMFVAILALAVTSVKTFKKN